MEVPLALIAELTHRCPLHCVYCSNPVQLASASAELSTQEWQSAFEQCARLGMLHVHLSGGEPLARQDVIELVTFAHDVGLYTNLITSAIGLSEQKLAALVKSGLDHIQLSFQDSREADANSIAGTRAHALKLEVAKKVRETGLAFTINIVVHRKNIDHLDELIALAEALGPQRLEIAHTQYYGWAKENIDFLLPTRAQVVESMETIARAQKRLSGKLRIDAVAPDYYARYPKACMGGWGRRQMLIEPSGKALPCHAAAVIPGLKFDNVRQHSVEWIWWQSESFGKFRGEDWMLDPCRTCDRRVEDFGGCRCQAFMIAGSAERADPVCSLSPDHHLIELQLVRANSADRPVRNDGPVPAEPASHWIYRPQPI